MAGFWRRKHTQIRIPDLTCRDQRLAAHLVRNLMRRHGKTIRSLSAEFNLRQTRVRTVRRNGATGFAAAEWFKMLTGHWPDSPVFENNGDRQIAILLRNQAGPALDHENAGGHALAGIPDRQK